MTYEEQMNRLTEITAKLEREQLSLEEAAKLYKEGMELSAQCHKILQDAVLAVEEIPVPQTGKV